MDFKKLIKFMAITGVLVLLFSYVGIKENSYTKVDQAVENIDFPEPVKKIIDDRCYGCHNTESRGKKSKKKLNFDHFDGTYSKAKIIGKLKKIGEVLAEKEMPPEKFLAKYPEKNITPDESKVLSNWAVEQRNMLINN